MHNFYLVSTLNSLAIIIIAVTSTLNTTKVQSLEKEIKLLESSINTKIELELIKHLQICIEGDCVNPSSPIRGGDSPSSPTKPIVKEKV